jgi:hypothetical protein
MYIYIFICVCTFMVRDVDKKDKKLKDGRFMYICTFIHIPLFIHIYICNSVFMYITSIHLYVYRCIHTSIWIYIYIFICGYKYIYIVVGGRRAFDRELDVLSRKEMGNKQVSDLVEHAKELDSRFDKGSVQRSFL